jgi:hypothetical protein
MFCIAQGLALSNIQVASAAAAAAPATSDNTANVSATCQTPTTATLSFGNFNPLLGTALNSTTTIKIRCTNTTPITSIALSSGSGTVAARTMQMTGATSNKLNYQLYQDSTRFTVWGTTGTGLMTGVTGAGLNTDVTLTVYGQILANQQTAKPGSYSDSITVTVTY